MYDIGGLAPKGPYGEYYGFPVLGGGWRLFWGHICELCQDFLAYTDYKESLGSDGNVISSDKAEMIAGRIYSVCKAKPDDAEMRDYLDFARFCEDSGGFVIQ